MFLIESYQNHITMDNTSSSTQPKRVYTKLKFIKSDQTGAIISFVSQNPRTGEIRGVRQDSPYPKKICILDKKLVCDVLLNTLYDATLIPMNSKDGYVVIEVVPVQFNARIEVTYIPKVTYLVEVKFGNKVIRFDPMDGRKCSVRNIDECRRVLETRVDIKNIAQVLSDFDEVSYDMLKRCENDGYIRHRRRS